MPRVVVPTESDERAADISHRRRRVIFSILAMAIVLASAAFALRAWRARGRQASADTVFVSAPAWPKAEAKPLAPKPTLANREYMLQLAAYPSKEASGRVGEPAGRIVVAGECRRAGQRDRFTLQGHREGDLREDDRPRRRRLPWISSAPARHHH